MSVEFHNSVKILDIMGTTNNLHTDLSISDSSETSFTKTHLIKSLLTTRKPTGRWFAGDLSSIWWGWEDPVDSEAVLLNCTLEYIFEGTVDCLFVIQCKMSVLPPPPHLTNICDPVESLNHTILYWFTLESTHPETRFTACFLASAKIQFQKAHPTAFWMSNRFCQARRTSVSVQFNMIQRLAESCQHWLNLDSVVKIHLMLFTTEMCGLW